jgi:hypothetical protein
MSGDGVKSPASAPPSEVLFEFQHLGNSVRVVAIDPETATEVTMIGDPGCGKETLKRLASRKLAYVLEKNRSS